jgi:hypothetical protein
MFVNLVYGANMQSDNFNNFGSMIFKGIIDQGQYLDVYSKEFFARQPSTDEDPNAPFTQSGIELIIDLQNDPDEDQKPLGHLIIIHVERLKKELSDEILEIYPSLKLILAKGKHHPNFLIFNQHTRQMLCVGLGRKNTLFAVDANSGKNINFFDLTGGNNDSKYVSDFTQHDCYDVLEDLLSALDQLSQAFSNWHYLPGNLEFIEKSLDQGPDNDGLYYIRDDFDDLIVSQGYELEEIENFKSQFIEAEEMEEEAVKMIRVFFPDIDISELNTGDY